MAIATTVNKNWYVNLPLACLRHLHPVSNIVVDKYLSEGFAHLLMMLFYQWIV